MKHETISVKPQKYLKRYEPIFLKNTEYHVKANHGLNGVTIQCMFTHKRERNNIQKLVTFKYICV